MKKNDLIKMGLSEEQANIFNDLYKKALTGSVPKARLDEVIAERNALRIYIGEQDKKISTLEESVSIQEKQQGNWLQLQKENQRMKDKLEQAKLSFKVAVEMIL